MEVAGDRIPDGERISNTCTQPAKVLKKLLLHVVPLHTCPFDGREVKIVSFQRGLRESLGARKDSISGHTPNVGRWTEWSLDSTNTKKVNFPANYEVSQKKVNVTVGPQSGTRSPSLGLLSSNMVSVWLIRIG